MRRALIGLMAAVLMATVFAAVALEKSSAPAAAAGYETSTPACGDVEFPTSSPVWGTGSWSVPGVPSDMDVYSNGPSFEGTGADCSSGTTYVNGQSTGEQYQCMELVNRLYLTMGWISATWAGDAGQPMWNDAPSNLVKQGPGSVSYLGPGDIVDVNVSYDGAFKEGHVLVVNSSSDVTSGTVDLVSQNSGAPASGSTPSNSEPIVPGTLSGGSVNVGGGGSGWTYTFIGVIHTPASTSSPSPPSAPSSLSAGGDDLNDVQLTWGQSSGGDGGIAGYDVYRNNRLIGSTSGADSTTFEDTSLVRGTELTYSVASFDSVGDRSAFSPALSVNTVEDDQGSFILNSGDGSTYCRQIGPGPDNQASYLECTVFNGSTWSDSISGLEDWGRDVGWAWVSDQGNPAYCRQVGPGPNNQDSFLECTVFNGSTWSDSDSGLEDWGNDVGAQWVSDQGNPAYCRQIGPGPDNQASYLECTVFNGSTWSDSISGLEDWGRDVGWAWVSDQGNPAYCRQVGPGPNNQDSFLECTVFNGSTWSDSDSGLEDWGNDVGAQWVSDQGNPAYCRQIGPGPDNQASYLECTVFNGSTWSDSISGLEDWGRDVGWAWVSDQGNPAYCRQVGPGPNNQDSFLECTVFNGSTWSDSDSGLEDWGNDVGAQWVSDQGNPAYCRQIGPGPDNQASYLECTVFNGSTWSDSISGLEDWGYGLGSSWLSSASALPPQITSSSASTFTVGEAGSFFVTTTGSPIPLPRESGTLPTGVSFTDSGNGTAALTGTPSPGSGGSYPFTITASNGVGSPAVQDFTLSVDQAPAVTSPNATTFMKGVDGSFTAVATGFPTPMFAETGALPTGVTFASGVLSGIPTVTGTFPIILTASNGIGTNATRAFILTVAAISITTSSLPTGSVYSKSHKVTYSATLAATGGNPPYKWSLASGSTPLPPGLKLSSTGVISGKATAAGIYPFNVQVVDTRTKKSKTTPSTQNTATKALSISIG